MNNFKSKFYQWMQGRYGIDALNRALQVVIIVLLIVSFITRKSWVSTLTMLLLIFTYYRIFSKDIAKRSRENAWFMKNFRPVLSFFNTVKNNLFGDKNYKYYTCPNCRTSVRVPRGKGKLKITCPSCRHAFIRRT